MVKDTHVCCICNKSYTHCEYCTGVKTYTPWRNIVDTIDHYKIFMIVKQFNEKTLDLVSAKEQLSQADISGWENFDTNVVKIMKEILGHDNKKSKK